MPEHGSLGASGDLAPLAHCALALIGEGEVDCPDGARRPAAARRSRDAGIEPVALEREGGARADQRHRRDARDAGAGDAPTSRRLLRVADVTAAMSVEALLGTDRAFAAELIALRPQPGQAASAANLRALLAGSEIVASHRDGDPRVQDAYSLRCAPQVAGAARDTLDLRRAASRTPSCARRSTTRWCSPDGRVESCGNFHGAPVAFACDFLAIAAAEVGAIAERRTDRLLDATRSHGLPPFLAEDPGVNSGLMLAHYAQAAIVAENRRLAAPGERRLAADERDAGGPRVDGLGRGAQAAAARSPTSARILAVELVVRGAGARPARAAAPGARRPARRSRASARSSPGPGPDRFRRPELAEAERAGRVGRAARCGRGAVGSAAMSVAASAARRGAPSSRAAAGSRRPRCGC